MKIKKIIQSGKYILAALVSSTAYAWDVPIECTSGSVECYYMYNDTDRALNLNITEFHNDDAELHQSCEGDDWDYVCLNQGSRVKILPGEYKRLFTVETWTPGYGATMGLRVTEDDLGELRTGVHFNGERFAHLNNTFTFHWGDPYIDSLDPIGLVPFYKLSGMPVRNGPHFAQNKCRILGVNEPDDGFLENNWGYFVTDVQGQNCWAGANFNIGSEVLGEYKRNPVQNNWHKGKISVQDGLWSWTNDANVSWSLFPNNTVYAFDTDTENPYWHNENGKKFKLDRDKDEFGSYVTGFHFQNEFYESAKAAQRGSCPSEFGPNLNQAPKSIIVAGDRIGVQSGRELWVFENGEWHMIHGNIDDFDMDGSRIGVQVGRALSIKEGRLGAGWHSVHGNIDAFSLSGNRIGVQVGRALSVKEGHLGAGWSLVHGNIDDFKLEGNRIAVRVGRTLSVKEGGLGAGWSSIHGNIDDYDLAGNRVGVRVGRNLAVKEGGLGSGWHSIHGNIDSFTLSSNVVAMKNGDSVATKSGGLGSGWKAKGKADFYAVNNNEFFTTRGQTVNWANLNEGCNNYIDPAPKVATLYQHGGYGGYSVRLSEGNYDLPVLIALGMRNDDISSVKVTNGYKVTAYQNGGFGGWAAEYENDTTFVGSRNDQFSAIKVEKLH